MKGKGYIAPLVVLYAAAFIAGFNENLMNMGLYSIMGDYGIDKPVAQWLVTGYMIMATVVVMSMAFLYRRFKLRLLFYVGICLTAVGSVMGLFAPNFALLLVARIVQAAGAGLFIPMMMNSILVWAPKNRLGTFMSIGGCMITFGPAFAPVVCGSLVTAFGWHSVFAVPLVVVIVLAIAGAFVLRDVPNTEAHLDLPSVALSAVFLFTLSFGLSQVTISVVTGVVSLLVAVASGAVFVIRQGRCAHPLIDMTPMKSVRFWPAVVLVVVAMTTTFSLSVLLPLYFEGALGMSAFVAGIVILVPVLLNAACTLIGGRVMDSKGEWPLLPVGMALMTLGALAMAIVAPGMSAPAMFGAALIAYAGVGLVMSPSQTAGLRTLPPEENAFGVALMTTFVQIAACIGPALFTGVMTSSQMASEAAGVTVEAATARGFSSAIAVAAAICAVGLVDAFAFALAARSRDKAKLAEQTGAPVAAPQDAAQPAGAPAAPASLETATIAEVMQSDPYTIPATAHVSEAMHQLIDRKVSGMPLVDEGGAPVGFVSDGDIMRYLVAQHPLVTSAWSLLEAASSTTIDERLRELMDLPVSDIATEKVVSLGVNTTLKDACELLAQHKFKKVPIVSQGRVVGVVNRSDVLRRAMSSYLASEEAEKAAGTSGQAQGDQQPPQGQPGSPEQPAK